MLTLIVYLWLGRQLNIVMISVLLYRASLIDNNYWVKFTAFTGLQGRLFFKVYTYKSRIANFYVKDTFPTLTSNISKQSRRYFLCEYCDAFSIAFRKPNQAKAKWVILKAWDRIFWEFLWN